MKKNFFISKIIFCVFSLFFVVIMSSFSYESSDDHEQPVLKESRNGCQFPAKGELRVLVIFAEVEYLNGGDPMPNGSTGWPKGALPIWKDSIFEPNLTNELSSKAIVTRYFQEASSKNFTPLGDYLLAPDNNGVFKVSMPDSNYSQWAIYDSLVANVNRKMNGNISTANGFSSINDFDKWIIPSQGENFGMPKQPAGNIKKWDHVMIIWRNFKINNTSMDGLGYFFCKVYSASWLSSRDL